MATDLSKLTAELIFTEPEEEENKLPSYRDRDWLLVHILHDGTGGYPLTVEEHAYGYGCAFWIQEGTGFDFWIDQFFTTLTLAEGWWVIEGITGDYIRGDGWMTDNDEDWSFEFVRPATQGEIDHLSVNTCTI